MPKDLQVQITSSRTAVAWWRGVKTERKVMRGKFLGYKVITKTNLGFFFMKLRIKQLLVFTRMVDQEFLADIWMQIILFQVFLVFRSFFLS